MIPGVVLYKYNEENLMDHKGTKTLETERLILRKTLDSDVEHMFNNWANDDKVTKFLSWQPYKDPQQLRETYHKYLMESQEKDDFYDWKIILKKTGKPIGSIGVVHLREFDAETEIGYCLGYDWWHQGIMTEAFKRVIKFLFEEVGVNRIVSLHDLNNQHSGDVMKKCGLRYEGTLRQARMTNQGLCDMALYAILKEDYKKTKQ